MLPHIDIIDMNVLGDIRLARLDVDFGFTIFSGHEAFLHSLRNMQGAVTVGTFHFCKSHCFTLLLVF